MKIFGYGSLMHVQSTLRTMPHATNFQPAILSGYKRCFSLVSIWGLRNRISFLETKELAALCIVPSKYHSVNGIVFDIPEDQFPAYLEREHRYYCIDVTVEISIRGHEPQLVSAKTVVPYKSNEDYFVAKYSSQEEWQEKIAQYYDGSLFERTDIFPMRSYLADCLVAANVLGSDAWLHNFYDECFLSDGKTTIRSYIADHPDRFPGHSLL